MSYAYEFNFVDAFSTDLFNACPNASPNLSVLVSDACNSIATVLRLKPGIQNMSMPVTYKQRQFMVRISRSPQ